MGARSKPRWLLLGAVALIGALAGFAGGLSMEPPPAAGPPEPVASLTGLRLAVYPAAAVLAQLSYEDGAPCPEPWLHVGDVIGSGFDARQSAESIETKTPSSTGLTAEELRRPEVAFVKHLRPGRYEIRTSCARHER